VKIAGTNFTGATAVKLGSTAASYTVVSSTTITVIVPSKAIGYYKWSVTNPAGTATSTGSFRVM